uniref:thermonuclease family protein n=1 Tax=Acidovorax sp. SUPP3334 TaxID=2920881 RepID=UPI002952955E|nr:thermonuclease family protein [Acidovorax sp. SUPP3334]BDH38347.1 thermonuclease family protein [Acidovorax sp. SUPP3334]
MMFTRALVAATSAAFFWSAPVAAEVFEAKVIGVADGDTLTVLHIDGAIKTPRRIRLSGIDAPEKAQPFGMVAREALSQLAYGRMGRLDCPSTDQYGRSVCLVRVDGVDVGLRMIEQGLAWHYKRYATSQPREAAASYAMAELSARASKTGLWGDLGTAAVPVPPWEWRRAPINARAFR